MQHFLGGKIGGTCDWRLEKVAKDGWDSRADMVAAMVTVTK